MSKISRREFLEESLLAAAAAPPFLSSWIT